MKRVPPTTFNDAVADFTELLQRLELLTLDSDGSTDIVALRMFEAGTEFSPGQNTPLWSWLDHNMAHLVPHLSITPIEGMGVQLSCYREQDGAVIFDLTHLLDGPVANIELAAESGELEEVAPFDLVRDENNDEVCWAISNAEGRRMLDLQRRIKALAKSKTNRKVA